MRRPRGREKLATGVRREQITAAAIFLLSRHGSRGLSVAAVAHHLDLVPSALYRHFRNKEEVIDAALEVTRQTMLANVREAAAPDALEHLHRIALGHARLIRENQAIPRILFGEALSTGHPDRKRKISRLIRVYLDEIAEIVRRGQKEGRIRADIDPSTTALLLIGLVQPAGLLWFVTDGRFDVIRQVRKGWRLFEAAIRKN